MFNRFDAIVIGVSAGGLSVLIHILSSLPASFQIPIIIVQHRMRDHRGLLEEILAARCRLLVKQADEKEPILSGRVYVAPPDYHLLIEPDQTFSLSTDAPEHHARPSIDVLFRSAADTFGDRLLGIILTGQNADGADGMARIAHFNGVTIAQDPASAEYPIMPQAAIDRGGVSNIHDLEGIVHFILNN